MLSRYKFNQIKVKTKFFNSYPASVYQRSEVIECLQEMCFEVKVVLADGVIGGEIIDAMKRSSDISFK